MYSVKPQTQLGFTLIEAMIVVLLVAIFATFAAPNFGDMVARQRVRTNAVTVANAFSFAAEEAVRQSKTVFVSPATIKNDGTLNGGTTSWYDANQENGMVVFADAASSGTAKIYDAGEDLRTVAYNGNPIISVSARTILSLDNASGSSNIAEGKVDGFAYSSDGLLYVRKTDNKTAILGEPGYIGRVTVQDKRQKNARAGLFCRVVRIDTLGRASVCDDKATRAAASDKNAFCHCE